ncbi:MAG: hypothetical protein Fur0043_15400 [Anaerolineales bacterium]
MALGGMVGVEVGLSEAVAVRVALGGEVNVGRGGVGVEVAG